MIAVVVDALDGGTVKIENIAFRRAAGPRIAMYHMPYDSPICVVRAVVASCSAACFGVLVVWQASAFFCWLVVGSRCLFCAAVSLSSRCVSYIRLEDRKKSQEVVGRILVFSVVPRDAMRRDYFCFIFSACQLPA